MFFDSKNLSLLKKSIFIKIEEILYPYKNALWALRPAKPLGVLSRHPCRNPKPLPLGKGCVCSIGFASLQSPWAYTPGIRAGAECGAAALTKQGCLQSVAHSRYARKHKDSHTKPLHDATAQMAVNAQTQRHQRLTTRIVATPQTLFLNCIGLSTVCKLSCFSAFLPLCLSSLFRFLRHILKQ